MVDFTENKKDLEKKFQVSRRGFLKTGAAAAAIGVLGAIKAPSKIAEAAVSSNYNYIPGNKGQWSKLRPEPNYGGASVKYVENNDQWLGTSKIVGTVKKTSEIDMGFSQAVRGLLGQKPKDGFLKAGRHPLATAFGLAVGRISDDSVVSGVPSQNKLPIPDPEQMSMHIKDLAYYLRADEVGIGKMPEFAYYSHQMDPSLMGIVARRGEKNIEIKEKPFNEKMPYVIVVAVEQHLETYLATNGYEGIAVSQSYRCYHATANIAIIMAKYIREMGYHARAHHFGNYGAVMTACIIAAGMGELTRTGDCAAHPRMGFRNKVAAITTDLPLVPDKPIDFGMLDFCKICNKCAENCPAGAITHDRDPVEHNGYLRWNSDFKKCTVFRTSQEDGFSCGRCIKVCPWSSKEDSWFHEAGVWIGSHGESSARFLKGIDDMFGYGTEIVEKYKWWLEWPDLYKIY